MSAPSIKPTHKSIAAYYQALADVHAYGVTSESATERAFSNLLATTGNSHGWTLIPKQPVKLGGGKTIIPDGTLRDLFNLPRGYWEAKDTSDDLDDEIQKKIKKKYPLGNIIFEDTRQAVLFQSRKEFARFDLTKPQQIADLLNQFFAYVEPNIEGFEQAVGEFQERVPELAEGLNEKIKQAHANNRNFQKAFADFFELCQTALNPNIRRDAVDEMLIQHLLTERLFRKIFHDDEFTRRNVIASEVEKVIAALVSRSFSRAEFLKSLDKFYKAIELAADTIDSFNDKQHFLNTVYERFFQGYSVKTADTHGIVYTPQPIVDFMCTSVEEVLKTEFGLTLGSPGVNILDPCTGTGNFIVNLLRRVPKKDLPRVYKEQLFANEVMLLPYYIAALNIEHAYAEHSGGYEAFEGLCFVDTLELVEKAQKSFDFFTEKNSERVERQKKTPITVIIGNPPYNANQVNENDNNKNRVYTGIDTRIRRTYAKDSTATLRNKLYDPYVKFFRWASDKLSASDGVICFVTNNSFIESSAFDGMRKHLFADFAKIYTIDLKGDVRRDSMRDGIPLGEKHTVFGLSAMVGVSITILVRSSKIEKHELAVCELPFRATRPEKFKFLGAAGSIQGIQWVQVQPDENHNWVVAEHSDAFRSFAPIGDKGKESIFRRFSTGAKSNRDEIVYADSRTTLIDTVCKFIDDYCAEVDRFKRKGANSNVDDFVDKSKIQWSSTLKRHLVRGTEVAFDESRVRQCIYRPFRKRILYYDPILNDRPGLFRYVFPNRETETENKVICCTNHSQVPFIVQIVDRIANEAVGGRAGTCFPFYVYDEDGTNRRENITDWALTQFQTHYGAVEERESGRAARRKPGKANHQVGHLLLRLRPAAPSRLSHQVRRQPEARVAAHPVRSGLQSVRRRGQATRRPAPELRTTETLAAQVHRGRGRAAQLRGRGQDAVL